MLIGGVAGAPDPIEGYKWLLLAEKAGNPDSRAVREKSANQVSEKDRRQADAGEVGVGELELGRRHAALRRDLVPAHRCLHSPLVRRLVA